MTLRAVVWCAVSSDRQVNDKVSLSEQERLCKAFAATMAYTVVRTFIWDGYSRWESDPVSALEEFAAEGHFHYHELRALWQQQALDVLICHNHSRLGRSFTMQSWVIENVVRSGARVYRVQGGWIDESDYPGQIALGGYATTSEIERLRHGIESGLNGRAAKGLPLGSLGTVWSHRIERNERGKAVALVVDENKAAELRAMAGLVLEGVAWHEVELELARRFGYTGADGKPYPRQMVYSLFHHPTFWGHAARRFNSGHKGRQRRIVHRWAFDSGAEPPPGVLVYRDVYPPALAGDMADEVKTELIRRLSVNHGRAAHGSTSLFSGLLICGDCGYNLGFQQNKNSPRYRCQSRYLTARGRPACPSTGIPQRAVQTYINEALRRMLDMNDVGVFLPSKTEQQEIACQRLDRLNNELASLTQQSRRLVQKQAAAPDNLADIYDDELRRLAVRRAALERESLAVRRQTDKSATLESRRAFDDIRAATLDGFWRLPSQRVNQLLHALFGSYRLVVRNKQIQALAELTP